MRKLSSIQKPRGCSTSHTSISTNEERIEERISYSRRNHNQQRRKATSVPWDQEKHAPESYFTQGAARIKTSLERINIEEKQPRQVGNRNQDKKELGLIRKQPGWGTYKSRKNLDEVQTTWKRYIKNQRSLEMTWMNKNNSEEHHDLVKSENNPDKVHTSSERTWMKCKQPGRGAARTKTRSERTRMNKK